MGVGACILGYSYKPLDDAVIKTIKKSINGTLNCIEELELANYF